MLVSLPPNLEPSALAVSPVPLKIRPKMTRVLSLKTLSLSQQQLDKPTHPASSALPIQTIDILREHPLRILVAPSGFKESLGPERVADAIEKGVRNVMDPSSALLRKLPVHDGGEGFARALVTAHGGGIVNETVMGPVGLSVESHLGFIGDDRKTAVLDMAVAAGLRLVPKDARDPTITTTYGVGELIKKALDVGCTKIIIGCGDSGTSDGGTGMLQALGVRLLDAGGKELPKAGGGRSLSRLANVCWCSVHPRLRTNASKSSNPSSDALF
jgi:glycerate kinase